MAVHNVFEGQPVSGTYKGTPFFGMCVYTWTDSAMDGVKIFRVRLSVNCPSGNLPVQEYKRGAQKLPEKCNRMLECFASDTWQVCGGHLTIDKEFTVRK